MIGNKTINRFPNICPAGKHEESSGTVGECIKQYCIEDQVNALKHEAKIVEKKPFTYKLGRLKNMRHMGIHTESHSLLCPPVQNRYQAFVSDLKETGSQKYWTQNLGKARDATGNLPIGYNPYTRTCGKASFQDIPVKEIVNPSKTFSQVSKEYSVGHELYKKSHLHYFERERIDRKYLQPAFQPNNVFGRKSIADNRGVYSKACLTTKATNKYMIGSDIRADFQSRNIPIVGQVNDTNKNYEKVPEDHTYGLSIKRSVKAGEVLTENPIADIKKEIETYMCFLTPLRTNLKKKFNRNLLVFDDLLASFIYYDNNKTGWLTISDCFNVCACYNVHFEIPVMESYLKMVKILQDDKIDYNRFMSVLNWQCDLPDFGDLYRKINVEPAKKYYETSYDSMMNDYKYIDNSNCPAAGLQSIRYDLPKPKVPFGGCKADLESMGSETDMGILLNPTVYATYGLSFMDLLQPRKKEQIKKIFIVIGYVFDDDEFEKIWSEALEIDKTGLVCVDTFKKLLDKHNVIFIS